MKWAGGKARLAAQIAESLGGPCRGVYFEPFLGSGAVFLHLRAAGCVGGAVLSDANPKLVAVHVAVRDQLDDLLDELSRLPREDWRERYYGVREAYNRGPFTGPRHAARFLWLNRAGFNGLYRENRLGRFNVPVGRYSALRLPEESRFRKVSEALQGAELVAASFEDVIARAGRGDHVYCDPPYVPLTQTARFTSYCSKRFGLVEQQELAREARRAAARGARVVLSNHDLPVVREMYEGLRLRSIFVRRSIGGSRGHARELIASGGAL